MRLSPGPLLQRARRSGLRSRRHCRSDLCLWDHRWRRDRLQRRCVLPAGLRGSRGNLRCASRRGCRLRHHQGPHLQHSGAMRAQQRGDEHRDLHHDQSRGLQLTRAAHSLRRPNHEDARGQLSAALARSIFSRNSRGLVRNVPRLSELFTGRGSGMGRVGTRTCQSKRMAPLRISAWPTAYAGRAS